MMASQLKAVITQGKGKNNKVIIIVKKPFPVQYNQTSQYLNLMINELLIQNRCKTNTIEYHQDSGYDLWIDGKIETAF